MHLKVKSRIRGDLFWISLIDEICGARWGEAYRFAYSIRRIAILCRVTEIIVYIPAYGHASLWYHNRANGNIHEGSTGSKPC